MIFQSLQSLGKGSGSDNAVFESHWITVSTISGKWSSLIILLDSMNLSDSVRHKLACAWQIETTVLNHLLPLVKIYIEPLILGLKKEAES